MQRLWISLMLLASFSMALAAEPQLVQCRQDLKARIVDGDLLVACLVLINQCEAQHKSSESRLVKLVTASDLVRSNVERCHRTYGENWTQEWNEIKESLVITYRCVMDEISAVPVTDLSSHAKERIDQDISWLGLHDVMTASTMR